MWEEGARIYGTPGVHNNFPLSIKKFKNTSFDWGFPSILGFFFSFNYYIIVFLNRWRSGGFSKSGKWLEDSSQYLKHKVMDKCMNLLVS